MEFFSTIHRVLLLLCAVLVGNAAMAAEESYAPESIPGAVTISAEEVVELILSRPDLIIFDSRKETEYMKGHIEGAINMLNTSMQPESLELIVEDKNRAIVFDCNGLRCLRSSNAVKKAMDWGYQNIFWFRGGWKEWMDKRLPVITN